MLTVNVSLLRSLLYLMVRIAESAERVKLDKSIVFEQRTSADA